MTSIGRRKRAAATIGESATQWGIAAGRQMSLYILKTLPDWPGDQSDEEIDALGRATEASTLDTLVALYTDDHTYLARSPEPTENIAFYVSRGIPLDEVIRNVHAGQEFLTQELIEAIESVVPQNDRLSTMKDATRDLIYCWSNFAHHVTVQYAQERRRWANSSDGVKADIVRRILARQRVGHSDGISLLGYSLDQTHTALVLWLTGLDHETARMFDFSTLADEITSICGSPVPPLIIGGRYGGAEMWLGSCARPTVSALREHPRLPTPLRIAVGTASAGAEGFRLSNHQARNARRIAKFSEQDDQILDYRDVELVSLLASDIEQARAFVYSTIGPLCRRDTKLAELRKTLMALIDAAGSVGGAAAALFTHRNTVSYRLRQIDELLGTDRDNARTRLALEIVAKMPGAILRDE